MLSLSIQLLNKLLYPFHLRYSLSPFLLIAFLVLSFLFFFFFLQFFFVKRSNSFFSVRIINNICPWHSMLNFFNHIIFFRPIWNIPFAKFFLYFDILSVLNLGSLWLISLLESINIFGFTSTEFILIVLNMYYCIY